MPTYQNKTKDPSKNDDSLFDWARRLVEDGQEKRRAHEAQWWENIATYVGDLWSEFDVTLQKLVESSKPDHRVRLPVNLAQPAVRTEYAKLLKNRPIVDCLARSNDRQDLNSAEVGDKLLNHYVERMLHMPKHRRRMLQWVVICGMGGVFVDYDDMAMGEQQVLVGPNGQPVFDLTMIRAIQRYYRDKKKAPKTMSVRQGEVRNAALSPFQLIYDFSKVDFEDAWWCIVSEVYDVDDVFRRWEIEVEADRDAKPGVMHRRAIERWDLSGKIEWRGSDTQQLVEVHRLFIRPGHRYFEDGAEIVFTDDTLIDRYSFPFKHGLLPVGITGHVPMPLSQYSMSVIPVIKPLVLEISKTESQMIENRNIMSNPPWIEFRQNKIKGEIVNRPGARLTVDWMPNVPEPHPIEMPEIPTYVKDLIPILKEHVLECTGQSEVSQGKVPAGARAGVTIAYLQEEDDTKLGPTVQEYEECIERVAWLQLQVIAEKYDAPRTIQIYKKHSEPEVFDFIGTMLEGVAGVICQAGSALPRSKAAKQQFILDLWDRKIEQDPRKVREWLELNEGEPDEWEQDLDQAERENRKMMSGQKVPVLEWYNHPAHHFQHRQYMKSPEFEELPLQAQQVFLLHDEEHSRFERAQQQAMAAMQQMAGGQGGPPTPDQAAPQNQAPLGANGNNAVPPPQFSGNGNGFAPPEGGQTGNPAPFSPQ